MRLGGGISYQAAVAPLLTAGVVGGTLAPGQQSAQSGARGRVLNHSSARARRKELFRQAQHRYQPVEHMRLKLRTCWAGRPKHALHSQAGRNKVAENSRPGRVARKVSEEVGRLPVSDARENQFFDVPQQCVEGLTLGRGIRRKRSANLSWLNL